MIARFAGGCRGIRCGRRSPVTGRRGMSDGERGRSWMRRSRRSGSCCGRFRRCRRRRSRSGWARSIRVLSGRVAGGAERRAAYLGITAALLSRAPRRREMGSRSAGWPGTLFARGPSRTTAFGWPSTARPRSSSPNHQGNTTLQGLRHAETARSRRVLDEAWAERPESRRKNCSSRTDNHLCGQLRQNC